MNKAPSKNSRRKFELVALAVVALALILLTISGQTLRLINYGRGLFDQHHSDSLGFYGDSLAVFDLLDDDMFESKRPDALATPASLAKLFVIDYANSLVKLDEKVRVSKDVLSLVKPGSSVAGLQENEIYLVKDLYAAMLVPSGNDAAYVLADYLGKKLAPTAKTVSERQQAFLSGLRNYCQKNGYPKTNIYDPSGYDFQGKTTAVEVKKATVKLLRFAWFKKIVKTPSYQVKLPSGEIKTWRNTNLYLRSDSQYYNPGVLGVKTGSLGKDYNLVIYYQKKGKKFLIVSLGSQSDMSRYDDVNYVLQRINNSSSLFKK